MSARREQKRRSWIERQERWKDVEEEYERQSAAAASDEERQRLMEVFSERRRAHREEDVRLGKRSPRFSIQTRQIMWTRWFEVAVEHELEAREGYRDVVAGPSSDGLLREFHASLVAVTAAAHTIEGLYGEFKYLIPVQPRQDNRQKTLLHAFREAFEVSADADEHLWRELDWLFKLRHDVVHPYTESEPTAQHPAGINTGPEHSLFNAVTSGRAIEIALTTLGVAASPPESSPRWVRRWAIERAPYHEVIRQLCDERDGQPL
jgi:hypothetical protein